MTEVEIVKQLTSLGWPTVFLVMMLAAFRRVWPWWTDVYWPSREERWKAMHEADCRRDDYMHELVKETQETIRRYEDGHASVSREEHRQIIEAIRANNASLLDAIERLMTQMGQWQREVRAVGGGQ